MANLNRKPPCGNGCCLSLRQYIHDHLDPGRNLRADDDATDVLAELNACFKPEGGSGITVDDMRAYLAELEPLEAECNGD